MPTAAKKKTATKTKAPVIPYSPGEAKALDALKAETDRRLSSVQLIAKVYGEAPPFHARQSIMGTMRSLSRKIDENGEPFVLRKSERAGPVPTQFWLEDRIG